MFAHFLNPQLCEVTPCEVDAIRLSHQTEAKVTTKIIPGIIKLHKMVLCSSCDSVSLEMNLKNGRFAILCTFHDGSNEPTLASLFKWSDNIFKNMDEFPSVSALFNVWHLFLLQ
jgi:hypothetical protein